MGHLGHTSTLIKGQIKHPKLEGHAVYLVGPAQHGILCAVAIGLNPCEPLPSHTKPFIPTN